MCEDNLLPLAAQEIRRALQLVLRDDGNAVRSQIGCGDYGRLGTLGELNDSIRDRVNVLDVDSCLHATIERSKLFAESAG
jgi:hypothetical protein